MLNAVKQIVCFILLSGVFAVAIAVSSGRAQSPGSRVLLADPLIAPRMADTAGRQKDTSEILGNARTMYIWSRTILVKQEVIESALLKRDDYRRSGLLITKDFKAADLILTVRRANFSSEYAYDVVDQTGLVVAGGKVNSLFGTAAGKIANGFMKQLQRARSRASVTPAR